MEHKGIDSRLWDSYNKSKVKVTENKDGTLSPHKIQVAEVFQNT